MPEFNAEAFMTQTVNEANATFPPAVPEGEYRARVGTGEKDVALESIKGKKDPTATYVRLTLYWDIIDDNALAAMGRTKARVRDQFLVDFDETTGMLKTGPDVNYSIGNRREALDLNAGPFSLSMLRGAGPCLIRVAHRPNEKDPANPYAEIARAVKLS